LIIMSSFIGRVNDHERADASNVQGEYNGVPGRREQFEQRVSKLLIDTKITIDFNINLDLGFV
jgi:hypothetical protein